MSNRIAEALVFDNHEHRVLYATSPSFYNAINVFAATLAVSIDGIAAAAKAQDEINRTYEALENYAIPVRWMVGAEEPRD